MSGFKTGLSYIEISFLLDKKGYFWYNIVNYQKKRE